MTPDHDRSRSPGGRTGLADLLRGHRLVAGLTQAELASRSGIGVRTVRDLERGRSARPQRTTVELLADALDLTGEARTAFLAAARPSVADPVVRAWALLGAARLAAEHGAGAEELPAARAALAVFRDAGDVTGELSARTVLCALLHATGGHDEAREHAEAVLKLASRHGRVRDMAVAQTDLAWHDIRVGELAGARRRLATVDGLAAECGDQRLRVLARASLAELARLEGRYADAVEQGRRVATALAELGDPGHLRRVLGTVGLALAQDDRVAEALEVLAELRSGPTTPRVPVPRVPDPPAPLAGESVGAELRRSEAAGTARPEDAVCALIEGHLALQRGDRKSAAGSFAAAADAGALGHGRRDGVEALVGLAASTADVRVLDRLDRVRRASGFSLLSREEALLYALVARPGPAVRRAGSAPSDT